MPPVAVFPPWIKTNMELLEAYLSLLQQKAPAGIGSFRLW